MKLEKFNAFNSNKKILKYYSFDWDDNILSMPTVIHCEKLINNEWIIEDVSTSKFANLRKNNFILDDVEYRIVNNNIVEAFSEFRDDGIRGSNAFVDDVRCAINSQSFSPGWNDFLECLISGSIFSIITARGHESESIKKGVEYIIDNYLIESQQLEMFYHLKRYRYLFGPLDENDKYDNILNTKPSENILFINYLNNCDFIGVSSPSRTQEGVALNPETSKENALTLFIERVDTYASSIGYEAKIGFSDDDIKNIQHMENLFKNIHKEKFPNVLEFTLKNSNNPNDVKKTIFKKTTESSTPGMEGSTISMQDGNKIDNLFNPNIDTDPNISKMNKHIKNLTKISKKLQDDIKRNKKSQN